MNQSNNSKQVLLSVIGVAILVVAVVGVSFAFFNYTRTGPANTVTTGYITFSTDQSVAELTNVFPIDGQTVTATTDSNVAKTIVNIHGTTTYANGIDYVVTADEVNLQGLPVKVKVFTSGNATNGATVTQYDGATPLSTGAELVRGNIPAAEGKTNVDGTITVVAYYDAANILITDTPTTAPAPTGYTNGTTVATGQVVVSTTDWNNQQTTNPATFRVKVVATEGQTAPTP